MTTPSLFTRPHRLLLARFFSQGFVAAAIVTIIVGAVLTQLERDNYLRRLTESARERVARLATHIGHQLRTLEPLTHALDAETEAATPIQQLVLQEARNSGLLRLELADSSGMIIGSSDPAALGQRLDAAEAAEVHTSGQVISRIVGSGAAAYLHFAAPIQVEGQSYTVIVDEPLAGMEALARDSLVAVALTLSIGFALTFAVLGFVVRRAGLDLERHQQEEVRVKALLGRYVSHQVARQILAQGGLKVGGERREITVLFADIRGFTAFAEKLPPERVVSLLNDYLAAMTEAVFKYDGTVDKFLGDGLMAIFGAPLDHPDDADRALACAKEMQLAFKRLCAEWRQKGLPDLGLGIGINTGEAVVGSIGSSKRLDYTAIGDAVNTAHRLQSIALGGQVLLSAATRARVGDALLESLGPTQVKGRRQAVEVFRLVFAQPHSSA